MHPLPPVSLKAGLRPELSLAICGEVQGMHERCGGGGEESKRGEEVAILCLIPPPSFVKLSGPIIQAHLSSQLKALFLGLLASGS